VRLLTWNIQWCRGVDGKVDPARIAREARRLADPDVICFQEASGPWQTQLRRALSVCFIQ